jgi:KTSC domain
MKRKPVVSSVISEVGYESTSRTLEIMFKSGAIYLYYFVPDEIHAGLMKAASHGTYFNRHIKSVYDHHRIAEPGQGKPTAKPAPAKKDRKPRTSRKRAPAPVAAANVTPANPG